MQCPYTLAGLQLLTTLLMLGCAADPVKSESGQEALQKPEPTHPLWKRLHPPAELQLVQYSGSLCPEDTAIFDASDGAATFSTSTDQTGQQQCRIQVELTVPAGYRFKKPFFHALGYAFKEDESAADAHVTMHYSLAGERLSSEHVILALPISAAESDSFLLTDTPDLRVPECDDPSEPSVLDLVVDVDVDIPEGFYMRISSLEWEFELGVPWARCEDEL
jgi:hypothetical protein